MKRRNHNHHDPASFRTDEAGRYLLERVPTAQPEESVLAVKRRLLRRGGKWDTINYVYIVDDRSHLLGVASIKEMLETKASTKMQFFVDGTMVTARPHSKMTVVTSRAIQANIKAVPVTDDDSVFLGAIGPDAILSALERGHARDLLGRSGISQEAVGSIFTAHFSNLVKWRAPWLIFGLVGGMFLTSIVGAFEHKIEEVVQLAFFIPVMVYMGDAVGTQTQMLFLKGLTLGVIEPKTYFKKEVLVNLVLALFSGSLIGLFALIFTRSPLVAFTVLCSLIIIMSTAGTVAMGMTLLLRRFSRDPAISGGPLTTIIQDTVSLLLYFLVASVFLLQA